MKQINLTENEANELKEFYILKLEKTKRRLAHFQSILAKFEETESPIKSKRGRPKKITSVEEIPETPKPKKSVKKIAKKTEKVIAISEAEVIAEPKKRGRPKKVYTAEEIALNNKKAKALARKKAGKKTKKNPKKPSTKANWTEFIMNTIIDTSRPITAKAMHDTAVKTLNIAPEMQKKSNMSVAACMSNLARKTGKLKTYAAEGLKNQFYGLPEWFEENGDLKSEFMSKIGVE
ncbi:MAG: hypothetical protein Q7J34_09630 [Bacteroidales bacterium]|jgi:hypothetical protein|nr:hypothetical protein [Bacteroidales bacterium]